MATINRRELLQTMGISALGVSLGRAGLAFADSTVSEPKVSNWLDSLYANASQLKDRQISGLQWQEVMDQIYAKAPIDQLKKRLDFESLRKTILDQISPERGELFQRVELPGSSTAKTADGREPHRALITKVAHISKGRSIPPHGHSNMASAFLCISGEFEVRQFDRLEDQDDHMIVRQTLHEKRAGVGTWSSISDYRNNIHWLTAKTDDCYLFTSKLISLEKNRPLKGRINLDIHRAEHLGTNTLKAPKITSRQAANLY